MSSIYNNTYFYSNKIKVFPCAYRSNVYDATARLNTEYNFTHLPHTVDKASYIIEFTSTKLICVIQGYYFEIELDTDTGDYSILYNKNKYLNICVASPNVTSGTNFIEGPHLCSWASINTEDTLDIKSGSDTFFAGLKISSGEALSKGSYSCYALKLDTSALLPIRTSKIENKNGAPISSYFTTTTLNTSSLTAASLTATSLSVKSKYDTTPTLTAYSDTITANASVTINNTLDVKPGTTSVLKAESDKVTINKPTTITGETIIKGATNIENSSDTATDGNLIVAGTGSFSGELSVTADIDTGTAFTIGKVQQQNSEQQDLGNLLCADVEVPLFVKNNLYVRGRNIDIGNTSSVPNITIYGIQPKSNDTSTFANGELLKIDQVTGKIAVYGLKDNEAEQEADKVGEIFSIDPKTGETFANKINATVEGTSDNAINAQNVTDTIKGTNITAIFGSTGSAIDELKLKTINPGEASNSGNPIKIVVGTNSDTAVKFYNNDNKSIVKADTFEGNAKTASAFETDASITLTGDIITSTAATGTHGWTVNTTINGKAVTTDKIADNAVTNAKLAGSIANNKLVNSSITIGSNNLALGGSVGTSDKPFTGSLYFGDSKNSANDCKLIINGQYRKNEMEFPLEIKDYSGKSLIKFTNNYGANENTSVPKQIIYAATDHDITSQGQTKETKGRTELFGDKICIYAQGHDYVSGTIEAGTVDLSASSSNFGLKIDNIGQIKVKDASLQSSDTIQVIGSTVRLLGSSLVVASGMITIGDQLRFNTSSGNIETYGTVNAASFNATSDKRLKENIIDYKPEKSILDLPIKKFDFIDGLKNQIGCIAQDLKEICPEIVNENEKGYLSIQESKLVYLLLDEVKKLKNEVEELKRK